MNDVYFNGSDGNLRFSLEFFAQRAGINPEMVEWGIYSQNYGEDTKLRYPALLIKGNTKIAFDIKEEKFVRQHWGEHESINIYPGLMKEEGKDFAFYDDEGNRKAVYSLDDFISRYKRKVLNNELLNE